MTFSQLVLRAFNKVLFGLSGYYGLSRTGGICGQGLVPVLHLLPVIPVMGKLRRLGVTQPLL